ncbi:MAG: hypothetical protein Q8R08_00895 [bacterium]|nr:hypothetical protein [bacterium]
MNNSSNIENLEDSKAKRREAKKQPRMRKHGQGLKRATSRPILHIHKLKKK